MLTPISISLPRAKSIVIRSLIVNYIRTGTLLPVFDHDPNDIRVVYNALKVIDSQKKATVGEGSVVDVEDCGAAYRFLMALLAVTPGNWLLTGTSRLLERPIFPLVNFLIKHGADIKKTEKGWNIKGAALQIDNIEIDTSETSQYVSAVMMLCENSKFKIQNSKLLFAAGSTAIERSPYIRMTQAILQEQELFHSHLLNLADWSAAVFWMADALLKPNANYLLKDLHFDKLQGDADIVPWFIKCGLSFVENEVGIEVHHIKHIEITKEQIDLAYTPDIAMVLATLAVCYPFELTLYGLKNLNLKESNRLDILVNELSKFTKIVKYSENKITIYKRIKDLPKEFYFDSYNDHRFVMAWSLFKNYGNVNIKNPDCIKKSYPIFKS